MKASIDWLCEEIKEDFGQADVTHDVSRDTPLVDGKRLHGGLHAIKRGGFPHEIGRKVVSAIGWDAIGTPKLETDFVRDV